MKKELLYAITCLAFCTIIGGAVYEHINIVPVWSAAPPISLSMFQGEYGMKQEYFWKFIHPVNLLLFIVTLIVHWRSTRRKTILAVLGGYLTILIITSIYFVPELIQITTTAFSKTADNHLTSRASLWETLSLVRLVILIVLSLVLFLGLTKSPSPALNEK
ncbi:MAG: hypothetical protein EOO04_14250 [Chitinophagaceae bacterium]|nr:MAG: hypothetical protein EOO04_14250 [Chitinophagaceae bacterium]